MELEGDWGFYILFEHDADTNIMFAELLFCSPKGFVYL